MLILLPPSEGKSDPAEGAAPVDLADLAFADRLTESRAGLLDALSALGEIDRDDAVGMLGVSKGQAGEVDRDAVLRQAPAGPAADVYTGVLYDRLDLPGLPKAARKRAAESLLIASGLWGVVRPEDRIPNYRLPAKAKLPGIGGLAAFWRPGLERALGEAGLDEAGGTVLDMRSGAYASFWKPRNARLLPVRPFTEVDGVRKAVSHMAKATRGEVARLVLSAKAMPSDPGEVAELLRDEGLEVELSGESLDVIESG
ncbi:MAG: YaaA family protein [Solirubrobacterales bacterium]